MATTSDDLGLRPMRRPAAFAIPDVQDGPKGPGQGPLRELLGLISRRSESYAWRWDDGEWSFSATDRPMFDGDVSALHSLGIASSDVVDQTDSPVRFRVSTRGRSDRVLELSWDSISYDLMSMPPHVKRWPGPARAAVVVGTVVLTWWAICAGLSALGVFG